MYLSEFPVLHQVLDLHGCAHLCPSVWHNWPSSQMYKSRCSPNAPSRMILSRPAVRGTTYSKASRGIYFRRTITTKG